MKISQEDEILFNFYRSKRYGARRTLSEFPDNGWKVGSIDSLLKRSHKTGTIMSGNQAATDCDRRIALEDLVLSQVDKPKRHQSARDISHETAILCSSVHRIIYGNLQLKCFKRRRAQLWSEANRICHLTR